MPENQNKIDFTPLSPAHVNAPVAASPTVPSAASDGIDFTPLSNAPSSTLPSSPSPAPLKAASQQTDGIDFTPLGSSSSSQTSNLPNPAPPQAKNPGFLDKAWHITNTPLASYLPDYNKAQSWVDKQKGFLGGMEKGAFNVVSGLTSPLSLALMIGTMGTGGFLESAGGTVLKEALMAGDEGLDAAGATAKVEQFAKAAKAAKEAMTTGAQPVSRAVEATGMDYNEFRSLNSMLHEAGLNSDNLMNAGDALKDNLMATKGLDEETAAREAAQIQQKEAQAKGVLNGYFEQQGLDPAAAQTKIAQFQKAADAAKEAIASQSTPVSAAVKAASGMSYDEFTSLGNVLRDQGLTENDVIGDNITRRLTSKLFNKMGATPAQAQRIAKGSEFLMNAGFTGQQLSSAFHTIPQFEQALKEGDYKAAGEYLVEGIVNGGLGLIGATHALHSAGEAVGNWHPDEGVKLRPSDESYKLKKLADEVDGQHQEAENKSKNWEREMYQAVGAKTGFFSGMIKTAADKIGYQKTLDKYLMALATGNDPELARQYGNALADAIGKPEKKIGAPETFLHQSSAISEPVKAPEGSNLENLDNTQLSHFQHPGLPENIQEMVQHAKDNLSAEAKSHLERWMNAYHTVANGLDEGETAIFKKLRAMDDLTWNIGNAMGVLGDKIENHIHQLWERPDRGPANQLVQEGRTGNFETAVNTARRRVFQNYLEGLLAGYKIKGDNPIALIAHDYATVVKAAAHKNFLDSLRDQNVRGPDARPVVALDGEGHSIAGPNGENAAYLVNPNRVRNIKIADADVDRMRANGDLDRFLARKDIIDITPKIRMDNIGSFIDQYEQMAEKQEPQYDEQGNNILRQKIAMLKDIRDHKVPADTLNEVNAQQKPVYVWHPQDYISPSHRAFKAWNWIMHTEDGKPILSYSDMKLHPEYAEYILNRLGLGYSALRDESTFIGKIGKAALRGGAEAKHVLLSLSPFHLNQLALRAVMLGVSPYYPDLKVEIESDPLLKLAVRNGLTLASDRFEMEQHTEGLASHSKLISKIPILGHAMDWYQDFLFNRVMQKYKAEAFKKMFAKYREAHPDWSDDGVAKAAADHVNAAFGGVPWKSLGRSTATQDWARLFLLAPDWLESEMRFAASMFHGGLGDRNFSREQVAKMAAGLWGIARILNYTTTGNFHFEAPFGLATKDKNGREIVYSVRTMPTDILHMASDPMGFLTGRLSPAVRLSGEALTHRDIYGRKLAPGQLAIDIARNMAPIPVEDLGQMMSGQSPEVGNFGQSAKAVGITAEVYRSPAEKLTMELASQRDESGTLNHAQVRHLEGLSRIENGLRSGTITYQQLEDLHDFGPLTPDDYKKIRNNLKLTHGLDPDMAAMVTKVDRMTAQDALQVWNVATPREKTALMHVMIQKKKSYFKKAFESETPQERMNDQTFLTFRQMFREPVNENQE